MMFDRLRQELDFPFERCGIVVAALHEDEMRAVEQLYMQGVENGVIGIEMCSRERMLELEPKLSPGRARRPLRARRRHRRALPLRLLPRRERAQERRGAPDRLQGRARGARPATSGPSAPPTAGRSRRATSSTRRASTPTRSRGSSAPRTSQIKPRKGEYYLLDRLTKARPDRVVFPVPTTVSKGMLVIPTVEGTVLIGPTAEAVDDKDDLATTREQLEKHPLARRATWSPRSPRTTSSRASRASGPTLDEDFYIAPPRQGPGLRPGGGHPVARASRRARPSAST